MHCKVAQTHNPGTLYMEVGEPEVQSQRQLHSEFEVNLSYLKLGIIIIHQNST